MADLLWSTVANYLLGEAEYRHEVDIPQIVHSGLDSLWYQLDTGVSLVPRPSSPYPVSFVLIHFAIHLAKMVTVRIKYNLNTGILAHLEFIC